MGHEVKGAQRDAEGDHERHDDPRGGREALIPAQGAFGSLGKPDEIAPHDTGEDEAGEESQAPDEPEDAHEDIRLAGPVHEANAQDIDPSDEPEEGSEPIELTMGHQRWVTEGGGVKLRRSTRYRRTEAGGLRREVPRS